MTNDSSQTVHSTVLTHRERQILALVAAGLRNKEIAQELYIAEATVENHLHHVFEKLGVTNRVQAASHAFRSSEIATKQNGDDERNPS